MKQQAGEDKAISDDERRRMATTSGRDWSQAEYPVISPGSEDQEREAMEAARVKAWPGESTEPIDTDFEAGWKAHREWAARVSTSLERDSEILAYVAQTLTEHGAPMEDSEGRKLSVNGRLVDFLHERSPSRVATLETALREAEQALGWIAPWALLPEERKRRGEAIATANAALDALPTPSRQENA